MNLGENLLELRKRKGLSQEEVAEKLNVSRQTVSKWETNQSQPDFDKIRPLCALYDISANDLIMEDNEDRSYNTDSGIIKQDDGFRRKSKAKLIGLGIFLYFVSIVWVMISIPVMVMDPIVSCAVFLLICGVATSVIVYSSIVYKKKDFVRENRKSESKPILRVIYTIVSLVFTCLYLYISFVTFAWHITWILWIVYGIVIEVIKLIYMLLEKE